MAIEPTSLGRSFDSLSARIAARMSFTDPKVGTREARGESALRMLSQPKAPDHLQFREVQPGLYENGNGNVRIREHGEGQLTFQVQLDDGSVAEFQGLRSGDSLFVKTPAGHLLKARVQPEGRTGFSLSRIGDLAANSTAPGGTGLEISFDDQGRFASAGNEIEGRLDLATGQIGGRLRAADGSSMRFRGILGAETGVLVFEDGSSAEVSVQTDREGRSRFSLQGLDEALAGKPDQGTGPTGSVPPPGPDDPPLRENFFFSEFDDGAFATDGGRIRLREFGDDRFGIRLRSGKGEYRDFAGLKVGDEMFVRTPAGLLLRGQREELESGTGFFLRGLRADQGPTFDPSNPSTRLDFDRETGRFESEDGRIRGRLAENGRFVGEITTDSGEVLRFDGLAGSNGAVLLLEDGRSFDLASRATADGAFELQGLDAVVANTSPLPPPAPPATPPLAESPTTPDRGPLEFDAIGRSNLFFSRMRSGQFANETGTLTLRTHGQHSFRIERSGSEGDGASLSGLRVGDQLFLRTASGELLQARRHETTGEGGFSITDIETLSPGATNRSESTLSLQIDTATGRFQSEDGRVQGRLHEDGRMTGQVQDANGRRLSFEGLAGRDGAVLALEDGRVVQLGGTGRISEGRFDVQGLAAVLNPPASPGVREFLGLMAGEGHGEHSRGSLFNRLA